MRPGPCATFGCGHIEGGHKWVRREDGTTVRGGCSQPGCGCLRFTYPVLAAAVCPACGQTVPHEAGRSYGTAGSADLVRMEMPHG